MAAISEGVTFCSLPIKEADFVGLESVNSDDHVVVTCKTKSIALVNCEDKKIIHTWAIKHGNAITSPTIQCHSSSNYITVQNDKFIRYFTTSTVLEKAKRVHVSYPIHCVLSGKDQDSIAVFKTGEVCTLQDVKNYTPSKQAVGIIVSCFMTIVKKVAHVCVVRSLQDSSVELVVYHRVGETYKEKKVVGLERKNCHLLSCCQQSQGQQSNILLLWSDGSLQSLSLGDSTEGTTTLHTIPNVSRCTCMIAMDSTHVAFSGMESKESGYGIGIWDTKFGTLLASVKYPEESETHRIYKLGMSILQPCGKNIYQYAVSLTPSSLGAALGKYSDYEETTVDPQSWMVKEVKGTDAKSPNISELHKNIRNCIQGHNIPKFKAYVKEFRRNVNNSFEVMNCAREIWQFLIQEKKAWSSECVLDLVERNLVPAIVIDDVCSAIIQHDELLTLDTALKKINDVPESVLLRAMEYYLGLSKETLEGVKTKVSISSQLEDSKDICPVHLVQAAFINTVLSLPYSDVFLVEYLRKMDFQNVLVLLKYLHFLLNGWKWSDDGDKYELTRFQVADWINLLLDAHFTQLVLTTDAYAMLVQMHETVTDQVTLHDELVSLEALLTQLREEYEVPQKRGVGHYSIEVLHVF